MRQKTIADMKVGEKAVIAGFKEDLLSLKLLEMGCLPGEKVEMSLVAPLGDPIAVTVSNYQLSLRRDEASIIYIED
ncbi:FeoA family protein [Aureibacter tunicatorum]|uniref:Ferrous iron transport protein A n=1 Tax=Aureibacter tunicatorum TaxID=866807 RepID=A0AAE4BQL9_9BACT|nr:FeoA family protein [Aureibacter tunicatorum]MDR6237088.1 ferrous iron transport protein A [Aureibacter tunicatorum]BDD06080.1 iron transporter [Aureibacter tunicatorum]